MASILKVTCPMCWGNIAVKSANVDRSILTDKETGQNYTTVLLVLEPHICVVSPEPESKAVEELSTADEVKAAKDAVRPSFTDRDRHWDGDEAKL